MNVVVGVRRQCFDHYVSSSLLSRLVELLLFIVARSKVRFCKASAAIAAFRETMTPDDVLSIRELSTSTGLELLCRFRQAENHCGEWNRDTAFFRGDTLCNEVRCLFGGAIVITNLSPPLPYTGRITD